jgi:hypothetical protein
MPTGEQITMPNFPNAFIGDPAAYLGTQPLQVSIGNPAGVARPNLTVTYKTGHNRTLPLLQHVGGGAIKQLGWNETAGPGPSSASITQDYPVEAAYILNWAADHVYYTQLGNAGRIFATPRLNGCGVLIAGGRQDPVVVHANVSPETVYPERADVTAANITREEKELAWGRFYAKLAAQLRAQGILANDAISAIHPQFYQASGSYARAFGIRRADGWTFYLNMDTGPGTASTKRVWPDLQP